MNRYFELSSRLSKITHSPEDEGRMDELVSSICQTVDSQSEFFYYSLNWRLAPWIFTQLNRTGFALRFDEEIILKFQEQHDKIKNENQLRIEEALRILKLFNQRDIEVAILKGNLLMHTVYDDIGYKKMNDFDILIRKQDWIGAQEVYEYLDYIPLGFGWGGEKQEPASYSHAGMSFISTNYHCIIGTQWGLKSPTSAYQLDLEDCWNTTETFSLHGVEVKQLSAEYNILHLILHMGVYKCGIRDCMDVYNLLLADQKLDNDKLLRVIRDSKAEEKALFTLKLSNICSSSIPEILSYSLSFKKNKYFDTRLKKREVLFQKSGDIHGAYNDCFHDIEMQVFRFYLEPLFHRRWKYIVGINRLIFFPEINLVMRLNDYVDINGPVRWMVGRLKVPFLIMAVIAEEIGWGIAFMLMLKVHADLFGSLLNYFRKRESYFDYLASRNIDVRDIERIVQGIE